MDSKIHDYGYAYLFEGPEMGRQLLETCVDEEWVRELEIEGQEPLPTNLVDERLMRRQCDLLLRARLRGRDVYVLILLEYQSSPDRFMALRLATYVCLVWLSLVERSRTEKGNKGVREAVFVAWAAAGRPGRRRLKEQLPELVATLVKRGDLPRDLALLGKLLAASAATLDRLVAPVRSKTRVVALEERLARITDVARDLAEFQIPEELPEQERRHLEAQWFELVGLIRQVAQAEVQAVITSDRVVANDDPERVMETEDQAIG